MNYNSRRFITNYL